MTICGVVSQSGPNLEPLACGYKPGHDGKHAWAALPTFTGSAMSEAMEAAVVLGAALARFQNAVDVLTANGSPTT